MFYVGSIFVVVTLLPWNSPEMAQPYVSALRQLRVPGAAEIMRGVILTAVLSALNSGLFGSSRMLMALSRRGDAPRALSWSSSRGVPVSAILTGTVFGYCAVIMSYVSPDTVFPFPGEFLRDGRHFRLRAHRFRAVAAARATRA